MSLASVMGRARDPGGMGVGVGWLAWRATVLASISMGELAVVVGGSVALGLVGVELALLRAMSAPSRGTAGGTCAGRARGPIASSGG